MTINRSKVKNLCDCRLSVLCFQTGVRSLHRIRKLFWVINFEVQATCTLEGLNSGKGKMWIIYVEETVQWVIWMVGRRLSMSCYWWSENVLFVNVPFDMIACWLIHTELSLVLGPKNEGNWGSGTTDWKTWSGTEGRKFLNPWWCLPRVCIQQSELQVRILATLFLAWFISTNVQHVNASDLTPSSETGDCELDSSIYEDISFPNTWHYWGSVLYLCSRVRHSYLMWGLDNPTIMLC